MTPETEKKLVRFAGEIAQSLSFNRSIGQIFALLYFSETPLSLDEIAKRLAMSKGNASINLRQLEQWGAVRPAWVSGSRRDHYEAARDVKELAVRRLQEGLSKRLDLAERGLQALASAGADGNGSFERRRVQELESLVKRVRKGLNLLPKLSKLF